MTVMPERSFEQRMDALRTANYIRTYRANLKVEIKEGRADAIALLYEPPDELDTMKISEFLLAVPKLGPVKVNLTLRNCRISPSKTIGGMSYRQRAELIAAIRR